jgi:hypothetical protein
VRPEQPTYLQTYLVRMYRVVQLVVLRVGSAQNYTSPHGSLLPLRARGDERLHGFHYDLYSCWVGVPGLLAAGKRGEHRREGEGRGGGRVYVCLVSGAGKRHKT